VTGVMLGLLRPTGVWPAVLISSVLFGLGHLGNSALRGMSGLIAAQAFGAACQGVGFAALRLRTNTVWLLIVIHMFHDLFLQMGRLPIALVDAPIDTIMLGYGVFLLRRQQQPPDDLRSGSERPRAATST
jgi:membrane protease YdiL (CAAX protease family)